MKYLLPFLILPTLVMAQAPEGQMQAPSFQQIKQSMLPVIEESLPGMKKARACLSKADALPDVEKCMKTMAEMAQATQKKLGMPAGQKPSADIGKPPEGFEWNAETKKNMLSNIDRSIEQNSVMLECMKKSNSNDEMNECMSSKMSPPSR